MDLRYDFGGDVGASFADFDGYGEALENILGGFWGFAYFGSIFARNEVFISRAGVYIIEEFFFLEPNQFPSEEVNSIMNFSPICV